MSNNEEEKTISEVVSDVVRSTFSDNGMMLTGLLAVTTYISPEGTRCFAVSVAEEQGPEVTGGLAQVLTEFGHATILKGFGFVAADE